MKLRCLISLAVFAAGCATTHREAPAPSPAASVNAPSPEVNPVSEAQPVLNAVPAKPEPTLAGATPQLVETLTLDEALAMADRSNPRLAIAQQDVRMAEGEALQAGLWPNPVVGMAVESYTPGGDDNSPDLSHAENAAELVNRIIPNANLWVPSLPEPDNPDQRQDVVGITQSIPLGGQPAKARAAATKEVERRRAESDVERLAMQSEIRAAFDEVIYHQRVLEGMRELANMLEQVVQVTRQRFESGDIAEVEVVRSEANLGRFNVEIGLAEQNLIAAEGELAEAIGIPSLDIGTCLGSIESAPPEIAVDTVLEAIQRHPRTLARERAQERAAAELRVAEAGKWPELALGVNYRRYAITDQDTWDFGVEVELPLFDRNQGEILRAKENLRREEIAATAEAEAVKARAARLLETYRTNRQRVAAFERDVLPRMEETLEIAQHTYALGEVGILEVLDAHRALAEARLSFLRELRELRRTVTDLERLSGFAAF